MPRQLHQADLGIRYVERPAAHGHRHVEAARAHRNHPDAAARGRVAVRAEQRLAGPPEAFQVYLVADPVPRAAEDDAVLRRDGLQIAVIVGVLEAHLDRVVIHVADRQLRLDRIQPHRLELQVRHRARSVLRQGLIDVYGDLLPGNWFPGNEVRV